MSIREMIEDEYQIGEIAFKGKNVLDIGANIGDSSVVFAKAGAKKVYAFEPLPMLHEFLDKNISINGYKEIIFPHKVGLSDKNEKIDIWAMSYGSAGASSVLHEVGKRQFSQGYIKQTLEIVEVISYFKNNNISEIDILKMDCEMCEYALLYDDSLLKYLEPEIIMLEFHAGAEKLIPVLESCGYQISTTSKRERVGLLFATKS
jgi:FkbM family methyltransferase